MVNKALVRKVKNTAKHGGRLFKQGSAWMTIVGIALVLAIAGNYRHVTMYAKQAAGMSIFFNCEK